MRRILFPLIMLLPACGVEELEAIIAMYDTFGSTGSTGSSGSSGQDGPASDTGGGLGSSTDTEGAADTTSAAGTASAVSTGPDMTGTSTTQADTDPADTTGAPTPVCGDGLVQPDEECDDANDVEADGCLSDCTREWFVFVTSLPAIPGDIKGLIGADYQCRHRATKMFLPNGERYMAWISTSQVQASERLYHARGPYKLVNGLRVAASWDALLAGPLDNPINVTEMSETNHGPVYTGTQPDATRAPNSTHCDDWTDNDGDNSGWFGDTDSTNADWTFALEATCLGGALLYCFEQP